MINWVCKTCGRAIKSETKPNFCYFDRTTSIENISDGDSIKMGLFSTKEKSVTTIHDAQLQSIDLVLSKEKGTFEFSPVFSKRISFEFLDDVRYDPFTGKLIKMLGDGKSSLTDFQNDIMKKVLTNE